MKNAIIFGAGNIGSKLASELPKHNINPKYILKTKGIFDIEGNLVAQLPDWKKFAEECDIAFIAIPTRDRGEIAFEYASFCLEKNIPVVTCEKASLSYNFDFFKKYKNIFGYTASVGGGTKMLSHLEKFEPKEIKEICGVVNGTLNFIGDNLKKGIKKDEVLKTVLERGYAEPGFEKFDDVIASEMKDVLLKTVIIANHCGLFDKTITTNDVRINPEFSESKRCVVKIIREKIEMGFLEDTNAEWLPEGVNNTLLVNGEMLCVGAGAGADATVASMISDLKNLL